jgi:hypothetical protein
MVFGACHALIQLAADGVSIVTRIKQREYDVNIVKLRNSIVN